MNTTTFLIYLDACRYDYLSKVNTPFLYELSQKGFFSRVETVPGFTQEAAMMTGKYPVETGYFTWYRYAPDKSPFLWIRPFRFLKFLRRFRFYYPIKVGIRTITGLITDKKYPDPAFIPLNILPYFENISTTLPEHLPNLASLCRFSKCNCFEQTMVYDFVGSRRCNKLFETALKSIEDERPFGLYVIHVGELDGLGHRYGPHPELFAEHLKEIDSWIRRAYELVKQRDLNCNLIIASDHGMVDVKDTIDIERKLKRIQLKVPKDYVYFLDSTMARFWFSNDKARYLIEEILSNIPNGHILSQEEKERLHINFEHNAYGELLFWVNKGYLIFPNFFQSIVSEKTKGMHGYINDDDGALIVYSDGKNMKKIIKKDVVPLVEVYQITRNLVGL